MASILLKFASRSDTDVYQGLVSSGYDFSSNKPLGMDYYDSIVYLDLVGQMSVGLAISTFSKGFIYYVTSNPEIQISSDQQARACIVHVNSHETNVIIRALKDSGLEISERKKNIEEM